MTGEPLPRRGVALVIGVGQYAHPTIGPLAHAAEDAHALADLLTDPHTCAFPPDRVAQLTDAAAGREAIVKHLSEWLPAHSHGAEIALIYFAGHGVARPGGGKHEGYLLPHDADPTSPAVRGVAMADLLKWAGELQVGAVVVCLDCCHAGLAITLRDPTLRDVTVHPAAAGGPGTRGRFVMVACEERQKSAEVAVLGHGLFTAHLLKGIAGEGDRDGDGKVGMAELFEYVATAVAEDTRKMGLEQRPWTEVVAAGGEYISRPRRRTDVRDPSFPGFADEHDAAAAVADIKRRMAGATGPALQQLLRQAGRIADPLAVPVVMPYLGHADDAVAEMAKRAVQAIGIEKAFAAVEELARRGSPDLGPVLDGLGAFGARPDLVRLLDRVADFASGDVLAKAVNLLERKRLGLELESMRKLFRDNRVPYELRRPLGKGHLTAAYEADDPDGQMRVVVRVLLDEHVGNLDTRRRFFAVCQQSLKLNSGHLVKTLHVRALREGGAYYAVREYLDTPTLQEVLAGRPPEVPGRRFAPPQAVEMVQQLLSGLRDVHAAGSCHWGVRPSNVFVCANLRVVLGDLAPAPPTVGPGKDRRRVYNYRYTPPEVFRGDDDIGPPADVYALGCVAYELFCGEPPVVSDRYHDQYTGHTDRPLAPARAHQPQLPAEAESFLARLLARDPAARPTAAAALDEVAAVRAALERPAAAAPEPPAPPPGSLWYYLAADVQNGPMSFDELKRAATAGRLVPFALVWQVGTPDWVPAHTVGGLFASPEPPAPAPPPLRAASLAHYRPAATRMSVGGDRPLTLAALPDPPEPSAAPPAEPSTVAVSPVRPDGPPARIGGYEVTAELGRGGMGVVYRARDPQLQRDVAIKVATRNVSDSPDSRARFIREARAAAAIDHPNVVPIYVVGEHDGQPFLVMPLLKGETLDSQLKRGALMPLDFLLRLAGEVAGGLVAAHAQGLVHRDVKPANIWLDAATGRALLLDFGLARVLDGADQAHTAEGAIIGTPAYMSPEQAQGLKVDHRADLWSLGVVLFRMATGRLPFSGPSAMQTLVAVVTDTPPSPRELAPHLPPALADLIESLMQKDPMARPQSATGVAEAIRRLTTGELSEVFASSLPSAVRQPPAAVAAPALGATQPEIPVAVPVGEDEESLLDAIPLEETSDDHWPWLVIPLPPDPPPPAPVPPPPPPNPPPSRRFGRWFRRS